MGGFTLYLTVLASRPWPKVLRPASQLELTNGANSQNTISQQPKSSEDLRGFSLEFVVEFYFLIPNFYVFEGQTACQVWAKRGMNRPDFSEDSPFDFGQLDPKFDHLGMIGYPYGLLFLNTYNTNWMVFVQLLSYELDSPPPSSSWLSATGEEEASAPKRGKTKVDGAWWKQCETSDFLGFSQAASKNWRRHVQFLLSKIYYCFGM